MKLFWKYSYRLFGRWKTGYGIVTFALAVVNGLSFAGIRVGLPAWFWTLTLVTSLYLRGFLVYKEIVAELPKVGELKIASGEAQLYIGWGGNMPSGLGIGTVLQLHNSGKEQVKLCELTIAGCDLGTGLLSLKQDEVKFAEIVADRRQPIGMPYGVQGRDWASVVCDLPLRLNERDPEGFARLVKELGNYRVELSYRYEDMDGKSYTSTVEICGSFGALRRQAIEDWKRQGEHELVYMVLDEPPQSQARSAQEG